jgi:negative regulator of flagellin synthesis FlgM
MTDAISGIRAGITAGEVANSAPAQAGPAADTAAPPSSGVDSVEGGQPPSLFATISATVGAAPAIDQAKVAAIRQSLSDGTYAIDPQRIAKQLLGAEQSLPATPSANE